MMSHATLFSLALLSVFVSQVLGESHTIHFVNNCGSGTPKLIQGANTLSNGEDFTSNGPLSSAIAYLQTGKCGFNGENCALVEMTMGNPTCPGCGSSVDISLIAPHAFNVPTAFRFYGGEGDTCDGLGASCAGANCNTAFFQPDDTTVQRACQSDNVNLEITFCANSVSEFTTAVPGSLSNIGSAPAAAPQPAPAKSAAPAPSPVESKAAKPVAPIEPAGSVPPVNAAPSPSIKASSAPAAAAPAASSTGSSKVCNRKRSSRRSSLKREPEISVRNHHARHQARGKSFLARNTF